MAKGTSCYSQCFLLHFRLPEGKLEHNRSGILYLDLHRKDLFPVQFKSKCQKGWRVTKINPQLMIMDYEWSYVLQEHPTCPLIHNFDTFLS